MRKKIIIFFATFCVILGTIGIFIPLLPTTPFLLLAIFLFLRSSRSCVKMILKNKFLAPYIHSYFAHNGIGTFSLVRMVLLLWVAIALCIIFATEESWIRIALATIAIGVTIHLLTKSRLYIERIKKKKSCISSNGKKAGL